MDVGGFGNSLVQGPMSGASWNILEPWMYVADVAHFWLCQRRGFSGRGKERDKRI